MKQLFTTIGTGIKSFFGFLFPPKTKCENIFQYILRQFLVSDSSGKPSITVTILIYVMVLIGIVAGVEVHNALIMVNYYDIAGHVTRIAPNGFSTYFLSLIIGLSIVITSWYRIKQHVNHRTTAQVEAGDDATTQAVTVQDTPTQVSSTPTPVSGQAAVDVVGDPGQDVGGNMISNVRSAITSFFSGNRAGTIPGQNR